MNCFLGKLESSEAELGSVYEYFAKLYNHYENEDHRKKVKERFLFLYTDSMGLAYMLTPEFASDGYYFDDDRLQILSYAKPFVDNRDPDKGDSAYSEIINFVARMSSLNERQKETIFKMTSKQYWQIFGKREFPALNIVAAAVHEMQPTSAASERIWSIYRYIHSRLRNRLSNDKVEKLVFLYVNCAILDENDKNDYVLDEGALLTGKDCENPLNLE